MTDLPFPKSLPDFQRIFPDDAACAKYLENIRWREGFRCACKAKRNSFAKTALSSWPVFAAFSTAANRTT